MDGADLDDGSDGNDPPSAPSEFLAEFLSAIMQRQYAEALKYCRLILQYEPHNATARGFYPLLQHKVAAQHAAAAAATPFSDEARCGRGSSSPDSAPRGAALPTPGYKSSCGRQEVMEQEADGAEWASSRSCGRRSRSRSSSSDDSCASQSSLEPDSSLSAGASLERSDSASGSAGGWESVGTAGSSGGTTGSSGGTAGSSGSGGAALAPSDDNGNALPASPSPTGAGLHSDDMENDNDHTAPVKSEASAATLRRLRAQFACSIK